MHIEKAYSVYYKSVLVHIIPHKVSVCRYYLINKCEASPFHYPKSISARWSLIWKKTLHTSGNTLFEFFSGWPFKAFALAWNTGKYSTKYLAIISDDAMQASFRQIRLYSALFFQPFAWLMTGCPSSYFGSQELSQQVKHELIRQRERCRTADVRLEPFWGIIKGSLVF